MYSSVLSLDECSNDISRSVDQNGDISYWTDLENNNISSKQKLLDPRKTPNAVDVPSSATVDISRHSFNFALKTMMTGAAVSKVFRSHFQPTRRQRNRLIEKDGRLNVSFFNVPKKRQHQLWSDIFTTLVEMKWRWLLIAFMMSFLLSWLFFAICFWLTQLAHGDFNKVSDPAAAGFTYQCQNDSATCLVNCCHFVDVFYFSLESQATIGYGARYPTTNDGCWANGLLMTWQTISGVFLQTLMAGLVFAKISRPNKRATTIIFSRKAVIEMVDGHLCLLIRMGDMRRTQLAEAHVRLQMVKTRVTAEGELYPFNQQSMQVGEELLGGDDRVFMVWPITIAHVIDEKSPLYELSKQDLESANFELIVILEGTVQSSGSTTHARSSYLSHEEIQWGYRFEKLVSYQRDDGRYKINFERFNNTYEVSCPEVSAKKIDEMKKAGLAPEEIYVAHGPEEVENEGRSPYDTLHNPSQAPQGRRPSIMDHDLLARKLTMLDDLSTYIPRIRVDEVHEERSDVEEQATSEL